LGLLVSAIVKNSSQANSALPLLLLPQIIFSGVLFDLKGVASKVSWFTISRWSIGGYGALVDINGLVPKDPDGNPLPNLLFKGDSTYDATWDNLTTNWGLLLAHAAIYLILTLVLQKRKDIL
jgi:hypothetical protein